jgi:hypothetical protein
MESTRINWRAALIAGAALSIFLPVGAHAGLYCCKDPSGKRICGDTLPKACVGQGYSVKEAGSRARMVAPPPTPEERAKAEAEEAQRKIDEAARKEQERKDQALLSTYSKEADIDAARERAEADVNVTIKQAEEKIAAAEKRRDKLDAEAEFYKNKPVPPEIGRGLKDAEFEIKVQRELIEAKQRDKEMIREKFATEKARYRDLRGSPAVRR